ncbi:putative ABC-type ATPase [Oxalobacteraceae bacterium GrIS 2.11]
MTAADKKIIIIAGPNGAGKTTFAQEFLPNDAGCKVFVNADLIAAEFSPFAPELAAIKAGKQMLKTIDELVADGTSFAFETTLSGHGYARSIRHWRGLGYFVKIIFLALPDADTALLRVAKRVSHGGHNIPEDTVRRRFKSGLGNFHQVYKPLVNAWLHFENSGDQPQLIDWNEE